MTQVLASSVADEVGAIFEDAFVAVEQLRADVLELFADGRPTSDEVLTVVQPHAAALLARGTVLGCGFVAARDALADKSLFLAWWQGRTQHLLGQPDAPAGHPLDYTRREWFRGPEASGGRHVSGPYVDYICSDEYVVTSTAPVVVDGLLVGIVGFDILVERLEELLVEPLRRAGATLVSGSGRVIASADHRLAAGTLLEDAGQRVPCGSLPLALVAV